MLKKIVLGVLFAAFVGVLVWGGVNRTLAKNAESSETGHGQTSATSEHVAENGLGQANNAGEHAAEYRNPDTGEHGNGWQASGVAAHPQPEVHGSENAASPLAEQNPDITHDPQGGQGQAGAGRWSEASPRGQGGGSQPLDETEIEALYLALDDEYHALAVYQSVIETFGEVEPFVEISLSEQNHIDALGNQLAKHGLELPENPWLGQIPPFESVAAACQAGVEAEIANVDLYERLFAMTDDPGLIRVFTNLSSASQLSHLPAFEACQ
ncbi:MAG: hypothetical protein JW862_18580 [Anaerolineales bacterium]|nr:hypothetical protein [Anaerolineales bacterium]